jgi:hypothetical protein
MIWGHVMIARLAAVAACAEYTHNMRPKPGVHRHAPSSNLPEPDRSFVLLRNSLARGDCSEAATLFERLNTTHWVPRRPDLVPWLTREFGSHATGLLVKAFAVLPCHFCHSEWPLCPTCDGRGSDQRDRPCKTCAGIGLGCCSACNGSGLVNYAAVPIGLRAAVLKARLAHAAALIRGLRPTAGAQAVDRVVARLQNAIMSRAMLANSVRAASEKSPSFVNARDSIPTATRERVLRMTRRLIAEADVGLRIAIADLAEVERLIADRGGPDADHAARRAAHLLRLAGRQVFVSPLLFRKALGTVGPR